MGIDFEKSFAEYALCIQHRLQHLFELYQYQRDRLRVCIHQWVAFCFEESFLNQQLTAATKEVLSSIKTNYIIWLRS